MGSLILIGGAVWLALLVFAVALCRATARGDRRVALTWADVRVRTGSRSVRRWMALDALRNRRRSARR